MPKTVMEDKQVQEAFEVGNIDEVLAENGVVITGFRGFSMLPMLRQRRDSVQVEPLTTPPKKRDVLLYYGPEGKFVLHRLLSIRDGKYRIRGDNNFFLEIVDPSQVIGILKGFYRDDRYVDCETDRWYRLYAWVHVTSYPIRWVWRRGLRPLLSKIKRLIFPKKPPETP